MHLSECPGSRPDLVGDDLVVDVLAELDQLGRGAALNKGQRLASARGDVFAVLPPGELEFGLREREPGQVLVA